MSDTDAGWIEQGLFTIDPTDPKGLKVDPQLEGLRARTPGIVPRLIRDMRRRGFDPAFPVVVWRQRNTLVDGHARRSAAIRAGVELVAVARDFDTDSEVIAFIIDTHRQRSKTSTTTTSTSTPTRSPQKPLPGTGASKPTRSPQKPLPGTGASKPTPKPTDPPRSLPGQLRLF